VTALQELDRALASGVYLFEVEPRVRWVTRLENETATLNYNGESEPNGMVINYYLKSAAQGDVVVRVLDGTGVIAETKGPNEPGINRVLWNMRVSPMTLVKEPATQQRGFGGRGAGAAPAIPTFGATANAVAARPGEYTVEVVAGGKTLTTKTRVIEDVWFDRVW
jgi:hypothetical protein